MTQRRAIKKVLLILFVSLLSVTLFAGGQKGTVASEEAKTLLTWNMDWPTNLDPAVVFTMSGFQTKVNLYSTLVYPRNQSEGGGIQPHVAESWTPSDDGKSFTFKLKQDIRFSDGSELEAEDVKFSMDRFLAIGAGVSYLFTDWVESTEVLDKYTVRFNLYKPCGVFVSALITLAILNKDEVMQHIEPGNYGDFGDYGENWLVSNSAGSGAYMVKEAEVDFILMEQNPYHSFYRSPNAPDSIKIINTMETATLQTMLRGREIEITDFFASWDNKQQYLKVSGTKLASLPMARLWFGQFNCARPPCDDVHIRKAISWAFDYEQLLTLFPGNQQASGPSNSNVPGWNPDNFQYQKNRTKAKEEIKQSKYYGKLDQYPVIFSPWIPNPVQERIALLFKQEMEAVGIPVKIEPVTLPQLFDAVKNPKVQPHLYIVMEAHLYPEAASFLYAHLSSVSQGSILNANWYTDPQLDNLLTEMLATVDDEERYELCYEIQKKAIDQCRDLYLMDETQTQVYQDAYIEWPQSKDSPLITGWEMDFRLFNFDAQKKSELQ